MSDAYTINNNQEAIRELYTIRSCFMPISVQYQSLSMAMESLQMIDELPNSEVLIPKSRIENIKTEIMALEPQYPIDDNTPYISSQSVWKIINKHCGRGDRE